MHKFAGIVTLVFLLSTAIFGFDGKRFGFILGGGLGTGLSFYSQNITIQQYTTKGSNNYELSFIPHLLIGFSPSNELELYLFNTASYFQLQNVNNEKVIVSDGLLGVAFTYHFVFVKDVEEIDYNKFGQLIGYKWRKSPYITGGIGFSSWNTPFEPTYSKWKGLGLYGGVGYEFMKHVKLQATYLVSSSQTNGVVNSQEGSYAATLSTISHIVYLSIIGELF